METHHIDQQSTGLQLFLETMLYELYWCEQRLCDVLDDMRVRASTDQLREAFVEHLEETQNQVGRLEKIFSLLGKNGDQVHCVGMQGLFDEGWQVIDETPEGSAIRDVALIIAAQKMEHYEIAAYGSLYALAQTLGYKDAADLLEMTLAEEKKADATLSRIANSFINTGASFEPAADAEPPNQSTDASTVEDEKSVPPHIKEGLTGMDAGAGQAGIEPESPAPEPR